MKKKRAFTLVELLAVIVVLAIILVIAIPNVIKVIKGSKMNVYYRDEQILENVSRNYLASNPDLLPVNTNQRIKIDYLTMKNNNYINILKDPFSGNECIKSRVYIIKEASNKFKYQAGLICDNYMSLNIFDLMNGNGYFEKDSNLDGLADNFSYLFSSSRQLSTDAYEGMYSQKVVSDVNEVNIHQNRIGYSLSNDLLTANRKLYVRFAVKSPDYNNIEYLFFHAREDMNNGSDLSDDVLHYNVTNNYKYYSGILTIYNNINLTLGLSNFKVETRVKLVNENITTTVYYDDALILDLTDIYGAGNEPSTIEMDAMTNKK
jgi:type IV pilus assembly protein PilA